MRHSEKLFGMLYFDLKSLNLRHFSYRNLLMFVPFIKHILCPDSCAFKMRDRSIIRNRAPLMCLLDNDNIIITIVSFLQSFRVNYYSISDILLLLLLLLRCKSVLGG